MPFQTYWVEAPHIPGTDYSGAVSGFDLNMAMLEYMGALQDQPVYFLMDFSATRGLPNKFFELSASAQVLHHPNTRWCAVVHAGQSRNSYTTRLLARNRVKIFEKRKDAMAFLRAMVQTD